MDREMWEESVYYQRRQVKKSKTKILAPWYYNFTLSFKESSSKYHFWVIENLYAALNCDANERTLTLFMLTCCFSLEWPFDIKTQLKAYSSNKVVSIITTDTDVHNSLLCPYKVTEEPRQTLLQNYVRYVQICIQ